MTKWSGIDFITKPISLPENKVSSAEGIPAIAVPVAHTRIPVLNHTGLNISADNRSLL